MICSLSISFGSLLQREYDHLVLETYWLDYEWHQIFVGYCSCSWEGLLRCIFQVRDLHIPKVSRPKHMHMWSCTAQSIFQYSSTIEILHPIWSHFIFWSGWTPLKIGQVRHFWWGIGLGHWKHLSMFPSDCIVTNQCVGPLMRLLLLGLDFNFEYNYSSYIGLNHIDQVRGCWRLLNYCKKLSSSTFVALPQAGPDGALASIHLLYFYHSMVIVFIASDCSCIICL
mgnify:CR=1 FL=1